MTNDNRERCRLHAMKAETLHGWTQRTGVLPTEPTTECGATSVVLSHTHPCRPALWQLADYAVSSVSGVVVWLVPR